MSSTLGDIFLVTVTAITGVWAYIHLTKVKRGASDNWNDMDRLECMVEEVIDKRRKNGKDGKGMDERCRTKHLS